MDALKEVSVQENNLLDNGALLKNRTPTENGKLIRTRHLLGDGNLFNNESTLNFALLDQYELYVGAMNQAIETQLQAHRFYLTCNTLIIGFVVSMILLATNTALSIWLIYPCIAGIFLTAIWSVSIRTHRVSNAARLQTIQALETKLPANIYLRERQLLREELRSRVQSRQANVEQALPYGYGLLYTMLAISLFLVGM